MKKRNKLFFISYICFLILETSYLILADAVKITTFGGSVIITASLILVGIFFKRWFNEWCDRNDIE